MSLSNFSFFRTKAPIRSLSPPLYEIDLLFAAPPVVGRLRCRALFIREVRVGKHSNASVGVIRGVVKKDLTEVLVSFVRSPKPSTFPVIIEPFSFQVDATRRGFPGRNHLAIEIIGTANDHERAGRFIVRNIDET
jgi:hypothetical protein